MDRCSEVKRPRRELPREERSWLFGDADDDAIVADVDDDSTTVISSSTDDEDDDVGRRTDLTLFSSQLRSVRQTNTLSSTPAPSLRFNSNLAPRAASADRGMGRFSGKSGRYNGSRDGLR